MEWSNVISDLLSEFIRNHLHIHSFWHSGCRFGTTLMTWLPTYFIRNQGMEAGPAGMVQCHNAMAIVEYPGGYC
jgi:hypothetical protein